MKASHFKGNFSSFHIYSGVGESLQNPSSARIAAPLAVIAGSLGEEAIAMAERTDADPYWAPRWLTSVGIGCRRLGLRGDFLGFVLSADLSLAQGRAIDVGQLFHSMASM